MKTCKKCGECKPFTEYYKAKSCRDGLRTYCKPCHSAYVTEKRCPIKKVNRTRLRLYGISTADYDNILHKQGHKCAICDADEPSGSGTFHIDHCHTTGAVRGLLCYNCNIGLGHFKDNKQALERAVEYLA